MGLCHTSPLRRIRPKFIPGRTWLQPEKKRAALYLSYWFAGLYVVIEGWRRLGLDDAEVDGLLASPNVDTLRRHNHGVFQFDKEFIGSTATTAPNAETILWARSLDKALTRFFIEAAVVDLVPEPGTRRVM